MKESMFHNALMVTHNCEMHSPRVTHSPEWWEYSCSNNYVPFAWDTSIRSIGNSHTVRLTDKCGYDKLSPILQEQSYWVIGESDTVIHAQTHTHTSFCIKLAWACNNCLVLLLRITSNMPLSPFVPFQSNSLASSSVGFLTPFVAHSL